MKESLVDGLISGLANSLKIFNPNELSHLREAVFLFSSI